MSEKEAKPNEEVVESKDVSKKTEPVSVKAPEEPKKPEPKAEPKAKRAPNKTVDEKEYAKVLAAGNSQLGDKDPGVIKWCKENMTPAQFIKKYGDRTFPNPE